jgi:glycosyltransferase involved in cell wall biosynthesis
VGYKIKNVYFFTLDITLVGGIERVVSNLANDLSLNKDLSITIVSFFKKNGSIFYPINRNVSIVYLEEAPFRMDSIKGKMKSHYSIWANTIKYFRHNKSEATVISTLANISIYLGLFIHKKGVKKIAAEHSQYFAHGFFVRAIRLLAYRFIDKVVTLTSHDKEIFQKHFGQNKALAIPNSLSFYPNELAALDNKVIVTVGRLVPDKGFDILIEAFSKLASKKQDWQLIIIGGGELFDSLQNQIEQSGMQAFISIKPSTKNIKEELLEASIYVCSSRTEAFPMALIEAMACGLPIVSFDCPVGPREIIQHNIDGILVENGNPDKLANALLGLMNNNEQRRKLGVASKQNVKKYLPEVVHPSWLGLIKEL